MLPGIPDPGDIIGGIITAFLNIFLNPGEAAIRASLELLLNTSKGPDFTAAWIVKVYAVMWGIGITVALLSGFIKALGASYSGDTHKFVHSFLLFVKSYIFGALLPIVFTAGFILSSVASQAFVKEFSSATVIDDLSLLNASGIAASILMAGAAFVFGSILAIEIWLITVGMPVITFVFGPLLYSFNGGEKGSKTYAMFWALTATSIFSAPLMVLSLVTGNNLVNGALGADPLSSTLRPFLNVVLIVVAMMIPFMIYKKAYSQVQEVIARGHVTVSNQLDSTRRAYDAAAPAGDHDKGEKGHKVRNLIGFAVAGYAGYELSKVASDVVDNASSNTGSSAPNDTSVPSTRGSLYNAFGKAAAEASKKRASKGGSFKGTAAMSAASIVASRVARRGEQKKNP